MQISNFLPTASTSKYGNPKMY